MYGHCHSLLFWVSWQRLRQRVLDGTCKEDHTFSPSNNLAPTPPPSTVSKLHRRHTGRLRKRDTCWERGEGGGGRGAVSFVRQESLVHCKSINTLWFFISPVLPPSGGSVVSQWASCKFFLFLLYTYHRHKHLPVTLVPVTLLYWDRIFAWYSLNRFGNCSSACIQNKEIG